MSIEMKNPKTVEEKIDAAANLAMKNMKILKWNLGLAIIRVGYVVRDEWTMVKIGRCILGIGYGIRGDIPMKTWRGNHV